MMLENRHLTLLFLGMDESMKNPEDPHSEGGEREPDGKPDETVEGMEDPHSEGGEHEPDGEPDETVEDMEEGNLIQPNDSIVK